AVYHRGGKAGHCLKDLPSYSRIVNMGLVPDFVQQPHEPKTVLMGMFGAFYLTQGQTADHFGNFKLESAARPMACTVFRLSPVVVITNSRGFFIPGCKNRDHPPVSKNDGLIVCTFDD